MGFFPLTEVISTRSTMQAYGGQRLRAPSTHHKMASPLSDMAGSWAMWIPESWCLTKRFCCGPSLGLTDTTDLIPFIERAIKLSSCSMTVGHICCLEHLGLCASSLTSPYPWCCQQSCVPDTKRKIVRGHSLYSTRYTKSMLHKLVLELRKAEKV